MLPAGPARKYFGPAPAHDPHSPRLSLCAADDLLPLTPYARYWKFYKAPDIQGNPYLWDAREAVDRVSRVGVCGGCGVVWCGVHLRERESGQRVWVGG